MELNIASAFMVGLMGTAHCVGMCGGLLTAFASQTPAAKGNVLLHQVKYALSYHLGRIASYTLAGAIIGGLAQSLSILFNINDYLLLLRVLAGVLMIVTGLYIANIWFGLRKIERIGTRFWQLIAPLAQKVMPFNSLKQAVIAGGLWGWLPCGLVYSMLTWSMAAGTAVDGALLMLAFGLGTLPALLGLSVSTTGVLQWLKHKTVRFIGGWLLIGLGIQTIWIAIGQLN